MKNTSDSVLRGDKVKKREEFSELELRFFLPPILSKNRIIVKKRKTLII